MNKILLTAFGLESNSSKILLDNIETNANKIIFPNDYNSSKNKLINELKNNYYDYIISFGQKPITKSIYIETNAIKNNDKITTTFEYTELLEFLENKKYKVKISQNAGTSLCNHIYYEGLNYIKYNNLKTKMIFIHIPYLKNISNIDELSNDMRMFLEKLINK